MYFKNKMWICLTALTLSAILLCGCAAEKAETDRQANGKANIQAETTAPEQTQPKELSVTDLLKAVLTLKGDLEQSVEDLKEQNPDSAAGRLAAAEEKTDTVRRSLEATITNLGDGMPAVQKQLENIQDVLDLIDTLNGQILQPAADMLRANPLDGLSTPDGVRVDALGKYIDFVGGLMPDVEKLVAQAQTVDLSVVDADGDLQKKLTQAEELVSLYQQNPTALTSLKAMLGMEGNRVYLLAAQNSAEIRASGGYPGAMGVLRIQDGILTIQDFKKVNDVLSSYTPTEAQVTNQETNLFHGGLSAPRDADYCPDFERVAYIWALGYEAKQKETVDGVIAMTPVLVQRLLDVMDEEITLFDGLTMDGSNACRVLQYDLYYKYFGDEYIANRMILTDQLFADAAKKTMLLLLDHLDGEALTGYLDVAGESLDDRTMIIWMKDEAEQAIIRKLDWDGGLNSDPEKPEAGVYVNCTIASKMGIFLEMDTQAGERTQNADGSYTYPITVTFRNSITREEINQAAAYITGGASGGFSGSAYFFAPAGGTVGNFASESPVYIREETYHDLGLGYLQSLYIGPGQSLTITYDITTAPGVETELTFSKTPTIQNYR